MSEYWFDGTLAEMCASELDAPGVASVVIAYIERRGWVRDTIDPSYWFLYDSSRAMNLGAALIRQLDFDEVRLWETRGR